MNKPKFETSDMTQKNIDKIAQMFPNCITETKDENGKLKKAVNFELLQQMLSDEIADKDEAYEFTWVGKNAAIVEANKSIRKTLRPCKEESVNWDTTENLYIEGDNLEVLKLLQESYLGKVKMIYIDPPYNTGNDFIYRDDFTSSSEEYAEDAGLFDEAGNRMFKNTDTNGRFHSDWCSMIYSRLLLARNLLSDDGVIFISIDDNEVENLRKICDEIFNNQNFIAHIIHKNNSMKNQSKYVGVSTEFVLIYAKNIEELGKVQPKWRAPKKGAEEVNAIFKRLKEEGKSLSEIKDEINELYSRPKYAHLSRWNKIDEFGIFMDSDLSRTNGPRDYNIINPNTNEPCIIPNRGWGKSKEELERLQKENLIWYGDGTTPPRMKSYLSSDSESVFDNFFFADTSSDKKLIDNLFGKPIFEFPKSLEMMKTLVGLCTKNEIVLDFFSGSATTAHAVMQHNTDDNGKRKFIMVQLPELCDEKSEAYKAGYKNICEIGKERIRRAGKKIKEENPDTTKDLDIGFRVLKVDDSNMKDVYYSASEYEQGKLDMFESNIKEDRNELDLLFGCLLDWGLPLSLSYTSETIGKFTIHTYNEGDLIACFNEDVSEDVVKEIARKKPLRAVFRDSSFSNSASKINVFEIFKMISPETSVKVI